MPHGTQLVVAAITACLLVGADAPNDQQQAAPASLTPRQEIERMSAAERDQLARAERVFEALPPDQQAHLRQLHEQIQADPELRRVMVEYHDWLATLQPLERAELLTMDPAQRVEQIRKLKQQQEAQAVRKAATGVQLSDADTVAVFRWMQELIANHQDLILRDLPPERRDQIMQMPPVRRRQTLANVAWMRLRPGTPLTRALMEDADFTKLRERLSPDAQAWLDKATTRAQKVELLQEAFRAQRAAMEARRQPQISQDELEKFFANDLTAQERDHLLDLPHEDMQRELRRLYISRKKLDKSLGAPPPGRGPKPLDGAE